MWNPSTIADKKCAYGRRQNCGSWKRSTRSRTVHSYQYDPVDRQSCERDLLQAYYQELVHFGVPKSAYLLEFVGRTIKLSGSSMAMVSQMAPQTTWFS